MDYKTQQSLSVSPPLVVEQFMVTKGLQAMSAIIGMSISGRIVHVFIGYAESQACNYFRAPVCVGPCIASQYIIDIAKQTGITLPKIPKFSLVDVPASLLFHFFEILQSCNPCAESASFDGIERLKVFTIENDDIQAVKVEEPVDEPKGRVLKRSRCTEP
jgi:hypothetical protein